MDKPDIDILIDSLKALIIVYEAKHAPLSHNTEDSMFKSYNERTRSYNDAYKRYIDIKSDIIDPRIAVKLAGIERIIIYGQV